MASGREGGERALTQINSRSLHGRASSTAELVSLHIFAETDPPPGSRWGSETEMFSDVAVGVKL